MKDAMIAWLKNLRQRGLAFRAGILTLSASVFLAIALPFALHFGGADAALAAMAACASCFAGATLALILCHLLRGPRHALAAVLAGMFVRMALPLGIGLSIHLHGGPLADAGLLYYLIVFYLSILAVETALSLPETQTEQVRPTA